MSKISSVSRTREMLVGKTFQTTKCGECKVIDYFGTHKVVVKFENPTCITECRLVNLRRGNVKNPLKPSFYGVGFIGVGVYGKKDRRVIEIWSGMLERCYSLKSVVDNPSYVGVTVCEEWYNFQNFAEWCYNQPFFSYKDERGNYYQMDKDIVDKGSRVYSPETCRFVPSCINKLLISCNKRRGDLPIGVFLEKRTGRFGAQIQDGSGKQKKLGYFDTPEEAFQAYKEAKEIRIKCVAEFWKDRIPYDIYEVLMSYTVEISD